MFKRKKDIIFFLFLIAGLNGCGSGEYDINVTTVEYTEKTIIYDTLRVQTSDTATDTKKQEEQLQIKTDIYSYTVQIGAYAIESNFHRFYENAKSVLGNDVFYKFNDNIYKIRIGDFYSKSEALKFLQKVIDLGYYDAFIVEIKK